MHIIVFNNNNSLIKLNILYIMLTLTKPVLSMSKLTKIMM